MKKYILGGFIFILSILVLVGCDSDNESSNEKYVKNKENKVTVVDLSTMTEAERDTWCDDNKVNCSVSKEYSDTVSKDGFVSQSVAPDKVIYEGDKITIVLSLGKKPTVGQENALKKAESYSSTLHMSKKGIYNQLTSSIEGFTNEEAQYAIDNIDADWNTNALEKAKDYQSTMNMSKSAIYNQLISSVEGFTKEEAQYAIDHLED